MQEEVLEGQEGARGGWAEEEKEKEDPKGDEDQGRGERWRCRLGDCQERLLHADGRVICTEQFLKN